MAFNPQFKINQLAKDMELKTKDLSELLASKGVEDVKPQKSLTDKEFDILMQALTESNQIDNIYDYMDGVTYIPSKIAESLNFSSSLIMIVPFDDLEHFSPPCLLLKRFFTA